MSETRPIAELSLFSGINAREDATRLTPVQTDGGFVWPLQIAKNVDIDNTLRLALRPGYDKVVTATKAHSLWSNNDICLFVEGDTLYMLNEDYSITDLRSGLAIGARMSYADANGTIYYTNGQVIGYVKDYEHVDLSFPDMEFKYKMPAGRFVEFYRGRLYVARDNVLWYSDPMALERVDMRKGFFQFEGDITMLRALEEGIYVADGAVHFLKGRTPGEMAKSTPLLVDAVPYTDAIIDGRMVMNGEHSEPFLAFMSTEGICIGDSNGNIQSVTEKRHTPGTSTQGAGLMMEENDYARYVAVLTN